MHWGRLLGGAAKAWAKDAKKENRPMQRSLRQPLRRAVVLNNRMPKNCRSKLKDIGNIANSAVLAATIIDKYRCVPAIEAGFEKQKQDNAWTHQSVGASVLEKKKLIYANSMDPLQPLPSYRILECKCGFYNQSTKLRVLKDNTTVPERGLSSNELAGSTNFFKKFSAWATSEIAWSDKEHMPNACTAFFNIYICFRRLKGNYKDFIDMVMMTFPLKSGQLARCPLLKHGLPVVPLPILCERDFDVLFSTDGVAAIDQGGTSGGGDALGNGESPAKRLRVDDGDGGTATDTLAAPRPKPKHMFEAIKMLADYVTKIDPTSSEKLADGIFRLSVVGQVKGSVMLDSKTGPKVCKKFTLLAKMAKAIAYSRRKLQPRLSDPDFKVSSAEATFALENARAERTISEWDLGEVLESLQDHQEAFRSVVDTLAICPLSADIRCNVSATMTVSSVAMDMMKTAAELNGNLSGATASAKAKCMCTVKAQIEARSALRVYLSTTKKNETTNVV